MWRDVVKSIIESTRDLGIDAEVYVVHGFKAVDEGGIV